MLPGIATRRIRSAIGVLLVGAALATPCAAQTGAAGAAPAVDLPSIKVGVQLFADYTVQLQPAARDADGNSITPNAFQIGRSYINVTGNISRAIAFRVTPDIIRETGSASALAGSYTFRLKYAYAQWNLDERLSKGSFARFGMQPTPWLEFIDAVYRYRFQGPTFVDREGFLSTSDVGAGFRAVLPHDYGDVHVGVYNGESYQRPEANDQKALQLRGTIRPLPSHGVLRGLRATGFWDHDAYVKSAERRRAIAAVTFEHRRVHAGFNYLDATDRPSAAVAAVDARGWSAFVTPRFQGGIEALLRVDRLHPDKTVRDQTRARTIAGIAYWVPLQGSVSTALMLDVDNATFDGFSPAQPTQRRIAFHAMVNF